MRSSPGVKAALPADECSTPSEARLPKSVNPTRGTPFYLLSTCDQARFCPGQHSSSVPRYQRSLLPLPSIANQASSPRKSAWVMTSRIPDHHLQHLAISGGCPSQTSPQCCLASLEAADRAEEEMKTTATGKPTPARRIRRSIHPSMPLPAHHSCSALAIATPLPRPLFLGKVL